jgi:hypothetical protein
MLAASVPWVPSTALALKYRLPRDPSPRPARSTCRPPSRRWRPVGRARWRWRRPPTASTRGGSTGWRSPVRCSPISPATTWTTTGPWKRTSRPSSVCSASWPRGRYVPSTWTTRPGPTSRSAPVACPSGCIPTPTSGRRTWSSSRRVAASGSPAASAGAKWSCPSPVTSTSPTRSGLRPWSWASAWSSPRSPLASAPPHRCRGEWRDWRPIPASCFATTPIPRTRSHACCGPCDR